MVECLAGDHTNGRVLGRGSHKWKSAWQRITQMEECLAGDHTNGRVLGR